MIWCISAGPPATRLIWPRPASSGFPAVMAATTSMARGKPWRCIIDGNLGNDLLKGGPANDYIYGDNGDNTIYGNAGDDRLVRRHRQ